MSKDWEDQFNKVIDEWAETSEAEESIIPVVKSFIAKQRTQVLKEVRDIVVSETQYYENTGNLSATQALEDIVTRIKELEEGK